MAKRSVFLVLSTCALTSACGGEFTPSGSSGATTSAGAGGSGGGLPVCVPNGLAPPPGDCSVLGIVIAPPYDQSYDCFDLGPVPGVPEKWGGLTATLSDPDTLLIGGNANTASGMIHTVGIERDAKCHVLGFTGTSAVSIAGAYNDGGVTFDANGILFLARWPVNELGQTKPGSAVTDKIVPLGAFGVASSIAGVGFVPFGFPSEGELRIESWSGGQWYEVGLATDANGTFDVTSAT